MHINTPNTSGTPTDIQGEINATQLQGIAIDETAPTDGQALIYDADTDSYIPSDVVGGGGSSVWGDITGTLSNQTDLALALAGKSDVGHDHDDRYYTESEIGVLLSNKSDVGHVHDDRYYTESETDTLLSGKAATTHAHAISDVTGLQTALDGKEAAFTVGTGLSLVSGTLSNSAPDQTVALTAGTNVSITGTYPNFTINSTASGLPTQTGNSGKYLTTDGTAASWSTISAEPTISSGTTSQYWRGDKSWQTLDKTAVGLSNVPNTDTTNASNLASGTVPTARLGSGTASSSTYLRGDGTWASVSGSSAETHYNTTSSVDAANGAFQYITFSASTTLTLANGSTTYHHLDILVKQNGTGGYSATFGGTNVILPGGVTPATNTAANQTTLFQLRWDNNVSKWRLYNVVWGTE